MGQGHAVRAVVCAAALVLLAGCGGSASSEPTGYSSRTARLATVVDNARGDNWQVDTASPAVLEQGLYNGRSVGVTLTVQLKTRKAVGDLPGVVFLRAVLRYPDGDTFTCEDGRDKRRAGVVFDTGQVEIDCPAFRPEGQGVTVTVSQL